MKCTTWLMIVVFYIVAVSFAVLCLATAQFRSTTGAAFDTFRLNYDSNLVLTKEHEAKLDLSMKNETYSWDGLAFTNMCLNMYDGKSGTMKHPVENRVMDMVNEAKVGKKKYEDLPPEAKCIFRGFTVLQWDKNYFDKQQKRNEQEVSKLQNLLKADEQQRTDLLKGNSEFSALKAMEKSRYTKLLVVIPYDLLIILLVMSMGLLGGIIRILRDYGDPVRDDPAVKDYFLYPLIGAVVAIGGYILAKTGLLLLSSTKGETSLSPFTVGIVGMVSGLLAKEVIDRLAAYGRGVLKTKSDGQQPSG